MALKSDLEAQVKALLKTEWKVREGTVVPTDANVTLGNDAVKINATVLYADLADSTKLVDGYEWWFAAEIYKSFLHCAAKIIQAYNGTITSYDGDRIMAIFLGNRKNTEAVSAALKINWVAKYLIQPAIKQEYPAKPFVLQHVCGIDTSILHAAKTGVRGANDLVWVGGAANYAAKLSALDHANPTWITQSVYDVMLPEAKLANGVNMWIKYTWKAMNGMTIYASTYHWSL